MFPGGPSKNTYGSNAAKRRRQSLFVGGRRKVAAPPPKRHNNARRDVFRDNRSSHGSYSDYGSDDDTKSMDTTRSREVTRQAQRILARDTFADNVAKSMLSQFDASVRRQCNSFVVVAAIGMVLAVVLLEISWLHGGQRWRDPTATEWVIKSLLTASTIVLCVLIVRYYQFQNKAAFSSWYVLDSLVWQKYRYFFLFCELCICGIHPLPTFTTTRYIPNTLCVFMIFRLYLIVRVLRNYCPLYRERRMITSAPHFQSTGSDEFNWVIALRYWFLHYQWSGIVFASIFFLYVFSYGVYVLERLENDTWSFATAVYQTAVTMTTVGYGDFVPTWTGSRICQTLASVTGILITSLAIFVVVTSLGYTPTERKAHNMLRLYRINESQRIYAATMIQLHWRHFWTRLKLREALIPQEPDRAATRELRLKNIRLKAKLRRLREEQTLLVADETPELGEEALQAELQSQHRDTEERLQTIESRLSSLYNAFEEQQRRQESQQRVILAQLNFIVSEGLGGKARSLESPPPMKRDKNKKGRKGKRGGRDDYDSNTSATGSTGSTRTSTQSSTATTASSSSSHRKSRRSTSRKPASPRKSMSPRRPTVVVKSPRLSPRKSPGRAGSRSPRRRAPSPTVSSSHSSGYSYNVYDSYSS